jgi:hypothetical protein
LTGARLAELGERQLQHRVKAMIAKQSSFDHGMIAPAPH